MNELRPLLLAPIYRDYIWGGSRIQSHFGRTSIPARCAESWEVADRPEGQSVVCGGPFDGYTLGKLVNELGASLLGARGTSERFPLLIKLIDARETLSVQVHPNNENAHRTGGEPKTEMWYILAADPGACIYAGFKPGATPAAFRAALEEETVEALLNKIPVKAGDAVYMPGGRVHAIGAGCLILECQQNSNTTYRLYDWGRVDAEGRPRELHIESALQVINWGEPPTELARPIRLAAGRRNVCWEIVRSPFFRMRRLDLLETEVLGLELSSFRVLFVAEGRVVIAQPGYEQTLAAGQTLLIPAVCAEFTLAPVGGPATVMLMDQP
ncbi:MAG: class I mannose-6-phosphate isomerase [Kiritimatiellae bacterium]|nr:class I mannose-6-phosphate isomerase [Kiritimatiellia bacterium]MCO5068086.1 class I mannose-6-phosphate isomerase [Kiritimatiellia bacterium]